jgi:hypothetical protein
MYLIALRHTTFGRTPLDEGSARHRDLYQTTHNVHKRQTSMPPAGFEPTIPGSQRPQTQPLDRAAAGIGFKIDMDPNLLLQVASKLQVTLLELNAPCTWSGV